MATKKFVAPALSTAPPAYDQRREDQLIYQLRLYFNLLDNYLVALGTPQYGATLDRPVINLQIGEFYFDTDLNIPIWYNGTDWVNASGTVV